ncbi:MAG: hypothetical protein MUE44_03565 [Oscillatoriaceae cyanobacterium Prado104]|nr:hypothetical protein [Oscillatoriaceae cyanobacterium Prado104]
MKNLGRNLDKYRTHLTSFHDRPSRAIGCHHGRSAVVTGDRLPPRAIGCRHERSAAATSDRLPPRAIVDHGYHPDHLTNELKKIYPDIESKIKFELAQKPC